MSRNRSNRRAVRCRELPGADGATARLAQALREAEMALAQHLAAVNEAAHFLTAGCASIGEYGARHGISPARARSLSVLGRALTSSPDLRTAIMDQGLPIERAQVISRILCRPELIRAGDEWVQAAFTTGIRKLSAAVRRRLEEDQRGTRAAVEVSVYVPSEVQCDFDRARVIASRKARRALTDGQAFETVVDFYLDKNDPMRRTPRARRVGDTRLRPGSRHVPREVVREVLKRSAGRCEVPGCEHEIFIELAHRVPHAAGGSREADNLLALCSAHHTQLDAGILRVSGSWPGPLTFKVGGVTLASGPPRGPGFPPTIAGSGASSHRTRRGTPRERDPASIRSEPHAEGQTNHPSRAQDGPAGGEADCVSEHRAALLPSSWATTFPPWLPRRCRAGWGPAGQVPNRCHAPKLPRSTRRPGDTYPPDASSPASAGGTWSSSR